MAAGRELEGRVLRPVIGDHDQGARLVSILGTKEEGGEEGKMFESLFNYANKTTITGTHFVCRTVCFLLLYTVHEYVLGVGQGWLQIKGTRFSNTNI